MCVSMIEKDSTRDEHMKLTEGIVEVVSTCRGISKIAILNVEVSGIGTGQEFFEHHGAADLYICVCVCMHVCMYEYIYVRSTDSYR